MEEGSWEKEEDCDRREQMGHLAGCNWRHDRTSHVAEEEEEGNRIWNSSHRGRDKETARSLCSLGEERERRSELGSNNCFFEGHKGNFGVGSAAS